MRKNLTLIGLLVIIAAVVFVALYRWDDVKSLWTEKVEGYEKAASAQECLDYVKKAQKDGNYDAMSLKNCSKGCRTKESPAN